MPARTIVGISAGLHSIPPFLRSLAGSQQWLSPKRFLRHGIHRLPYSVSATYTAWTRDEWRHPEVDSPEGLEDELGTSINKYNVDSLHRRLRFPKRRKGYEGSNTRARDVAPSNTKPTVKESPDDSEAENRAKRTRLPWRITNTTELERELEVFSSRMPSIKTAHGILKILVLSRAVRPTVLHYEAMILANCDATLGSIKAVKSVLEEMERESIAIGLSIYAAALKVRLDAQRKNNTRSGG